MVARAQRPRTSLGSSRLLFSSFSVVVAYVHQLTIFMIVPIFSAMSRIDKRIVEAALDSGANRSTSCGSSFCHCQKTVLHWVRFS
jgi:ABC-type spermidine/putrescine transport system permease subunit II